MLPNKLTRTISINRSDKRNSFVEDNSFVLSSPTWRPSIDEQQLPSLNSHIQNSFRTNQHSLSSLKNTLAYKRQQYSFVDITHEINRSQLSLRSISYGFGLGIKTWKSIHVEKNLQHKNMLSLSNYHLPSNKIELDINQQEIIRRTKSFKRKSHMIL
ncbi:unnamed protein product [Rotaria sp. Silwood1]|nr:unnamed protein product [Rotaria sp. Silwood1]CAF1601507.1 unnamed protein product [Rotaria sp. Silwood1]